MVGPVLMHRTIDPRFRKNRGSIAWMLQVLGLCEGPRADPEELIHLVLRERIVGP